MVPEAKDKKTPKGSDKKDTAEFKAGVEDPCTCAR